jgi:hypothetical protein
MPSDRNRDYAMPKVNIGLLKMFARKLPDSALREALLEEKEILEGREFLAKMEVWLSLVRFSFK